MEKINFGIDAPTAVKKLFIMSVIALVLFFASLFLFPKILIESLLFIVFIIFLIASILLILSSKIFKIKNRNKLIFLLNLKGNEKILDIGCGNGLYTIGLANKITTGKVYGIDIWDKKDLSNNSLKAIQENIKSSHLENKIILKSEDMRNMTLKNEFFDVIVASFSIHNIKNNQERKKAFDEINRVVKKSGKVAIIDFKNIKKYKKYFTEHGFKLDHESCAWGVFPPSRNLIFVKD
ncbi:MAG TPA: class I SAM-dependent methyltransferase [Candidatus Omnitrophota bacterium]|nr:class I SAM-dependent methyltransferase [Candidatus Omnitrophota bacterium]